MEHPGRDQSALLLLPPSSSAYRPSDQAFRIPTRAKLGQGLAAVAPGATPRRAGRVSPERSRHADYLAPAAAGAHERDDPVQAQPFASSRSFVRSTRPLRAWYAG